MASAARAGSPVAGVPGKVEDEPERPPLDMLVVADPETLQQYQCGICFGLLKDPKQCQNGHLFCDLCIMQCLSKSSGCPHCRCELTAQTLSRALFVENAISKLNVRCPFNFLRRADLEFGSPDPPEKRSKIPLLDEELWIEDNEGGCPETVPLEALPRHERQCQYAFRSCEWGEARCPRVRLIKWEEHAKDCPHRPSHCRACDKDVPQNQIAQHMEECPKVKVTCPDCTTHECTREDLEPHQLKECPKSLLNCEFDGCPAKMVRAKLEEHMQESVVAHTRLMQASFSRRIEDVTTQYKQALVIRDEKIRALERQVEKAETRIEWRVRNWSRVRHKGYLQSERFAFANMQWFIGFYTNGDSADSQGSISEYLFLDTSSCPANKRVTIEFSLRFVNHKEPSETVKKEFKTTFPIKGGQGWGDRRALAVSRLTEAEGFIFRDTLVMDATISLRRTTWTV